MLSVGQYGIYIYNGNSSSFDGISSGMKYIPPHQMTGLIINVLKKWNQEHVDRYQWFPIIFFSSLIKHVIALVTC
jgi:hypothetical protein